MRTRAPWLLVAFGATLIPPVLWLSIRNGSFDKDGPFIVFALLTMAGWATVGALLASRNPSNPIGWLMIAFGVGFVIAGLGDEWTTYAYVTDPGTLPLGPFFAWLTNWWFAAVISVIPLLLLLYPTGRVESPRWRWLLWAVIAATAIISVSLMFRPGPVDLDSAIVQNPLGIGALDRLIELTLSVVGFAYVVLLIPLCIAAIIWRFRTASGEERQQIRWLAYITALGGIAFVAALVSGIGLQGDQTNLVNDVSFYVFFAAIGLGVPAAIGVALLRYRLWDLDVVLKKTLVATVVVVLLTVVSIVALLILSGILVGPITDNPALTLGAGLVIGALVWPLLRVARRIADRIVYGGRATPYEVLTEFSDRMAETYSTEDVLPRMASILGAGTGAESVTIWLLVGRELRPAASWPPDARAVEARPAGELVDADPNAFEVRHQGDLLGAITVQMPANDPMTPSKERLVRDLTSQAGLVLRNVRLIEELRASRRRIVAAVDEGRRLLERNIHDGAQQQLVALAVKLRLADGMLDRDPARAHELLGQLQAESHEALENLRDLARGIYPPLLADEGLAAALEAQARKSVVPVRVTPDGVGRYPQDVEASVYFCVLEALQNVAKYAKASAVDVALRADGERLAFEVRDDGVGFDLAIASRGSGLQGMADRLDAVGGALEIHTSPGHGTRVEGTIPVTRLPPAEPGAFSGA